MRSPVVRRPQPRRRRRHERPSRQHPGPTSGLRRACGSREDNRLAPAATSPAPTRTRGTWAGPSPCTSRPSPTTSGSWARTTPDPDRPQQPRCCAPATSVVSRTGARADAEGGRRADSSGRTRSVVNRTILRHPPGQAPTSTSGRRRRPGKGVEKPSVEQLRHRRFLYGRRVTLTPAGIAAPMKTRSLRNRRT